MLNTYVSPTTSAEPSCCIKPDQVSTLIVTYNSAGEIADLLTDLSDIDCAWLKQTLIIDNASQDQTRTIIKTHFPEVTLVENRQNVGFARAVNQGFAACPSEYVFLLNPDMRLPQPDSYQKMLALMDQAATIGAVGPLQFIVSTMGRKRLNFSWTYFNRRTWPFYWADLFQRPLKIGRPIRANFLNCGCLLMRRSAFMAVGMLNEKYFLYGEEPDLFLKFARYGYQAYLHPGVHVIHFRDRSLRALPTWRQIYYRLIGLRNIGDALVRGVIRLAWANGLKFRLADYDAKRWRWSRKLG